MASCEDCGLNFDGTLEDHLEFCEAHTCIVCHTAWAGVVEEDRLGNRICGMCRMSMNEGDEGDDGELNSGDQESEEE